MADESVLPDDDGAPKLWVYTTSKHPTYVRVADVPLRRDEAIKRLRDQRPADLADHTHVTLAEQDMFGHEPITPHGTVRVRYTEAEQTRRMLGAAMGGFTFKVPTGR